MTLQELEQLKQRILSERCMDQERKSPRVTVGMGTCGVKAGAGRVLKELEREIGKAGDVVLTHVGCIGLCSFEPIVEIADRSGPVTTYCHMTPEKVRKVVEEHLVGGKPVKEWILGVREH